THEVAGGFYERDNLTGTVQLIKPGEKTGNWLASYFGGSGEYSESSDSISTDRYLNPYLEEKAVQRPSEEPADKAFNQRLEADSEKLVEQRQRRKQRPPVPVGKSDVIASSDAPPLPVAMLATNLEENDETPPFAVRQVDLNRDGIAEEIIQNAVHSDGMLDISIVNGGREIFFGRGKQIQLLSTRSAEGWGDIGIKSMDGKVQVYRYNAKKAAYATLN
ncbi:MAG TPA: hypothetical protein V6C99_09615, partial [Oculatellaceae cyanobacterium]